MKITLTRPAKDGKCLQSEKYSVVELTSLFFVLLVYLYKLQFEDKNNMKQENYYFFHR